jgi:hypothetical protein
LGGGGLFWLLLLKKVKKRKKKKKKKKKKDPCEVYSELFRFRVSRVNNSERYKEYILY